MYALYNAHALQTVEVIQVTSRLPETYAIIPLCVEPDGDGFMGYSPAFEGCVAGGETRQEAMENLQESVRLFVASYMKHGETLPLGCQIVCGIPISDALSAFRDDNRSSAAAAGCDQTELVVNL